MQWISFIFVWIISFRKSVELQASNSSESRTSQSHRCSPDLPVSLQRKAALNHCDKEDEGLNPRHSSIMECWKNNNLNPNRAVALIYSAFVHASNFKDESKCSSLTPVSNKRWDLRRPVLVTPRLSQVNKIIDWLVKQRMHKELILTLHEISHQGNTVSTKILEYLYSISVCGRPLPCSSENRMWGSCDTLKLLRYSHDPQVHMDHIGWPLTLHLLNVSVKRAMLDSLLAFSYDAT